jgi:hypothetical protein
MSGQSQASLSFIERTPWARYAFVVLLLVIGAVGISITWSDARVARASTSLLDLRIFLMGVALVWAVGAVTLALAPWWGQARTGLIAAHLLIMGLYIGLAVATTNWTGLTMRGWVQFWWAFPLMGGQIQQVLKLLRVPPSPQARSPRLVRTSTNALPETGGLHP